MAPNRLNVLEVLKLLPRTNCKECGAATCLAFANLVAQGTRQPEECPYLEQKGVDQARDLSLEARSPLETDEELLDDLTRQVRLVDFSRVAEQVGARLEGRDLVFRCLGKEFTIEPSGRLRSACHANFWILIPLLDSIVRAGDLLERRVPSPSTRDESEWLKFDELRQVMVSSDFFAMTCEEGLRALADRDSKLLADILDVFGASPIDDEFSADLSLVIRPLPKVPLLIRYWKPEDRFASKLSINFDRTAEEQLSVESIFILLTGIVEMLKKITARHNRFTS